jgi:hypothetical protein
VRTANVLAIAARATPCERRRLARPRDAARPRERPDGPTTDPITRIPSLGLGTVSHGARLIPRPSLLSDPRNAREALSVCLTTQRCVPPVGSMRFRPSTRRAAQALSWSNSLKSRPGAEVAACCLRDGDCGSSSCGGMRARSGIGTSCRFDQAGGPTRSRSRPSRRWPRGSSTTTRASRATREGDGTRGGAGVAGGRRVASAGAERSSGRVVTPAQRSATGARSGTAERVRSHSPAAPARDWISRSCIPSNCLPGEDRCWRYRSQGQPQRRRTPLPAREHEPATPAIPPQRRTTRSSAGAPRCIHLFAFCTSAELDHKGDVRHDFWTHETVAVSASDLAALETSAPYTYAATRASSASITRADANARLEPRSGRPPCSSPAASRRADPAAAAMLPSLPSARSGACAGANGMLVALARAGARGPSGRSCFSDDGAEARLRASVGVRC